ncbi:MAG: radical SAM protein [Thermoplasmata archaeon]|nr:radical SAM protein [Thermoplasmata archaeon]
MSDVQKALSRYSAVLSGDERPLFRHCKDLDHKLEQAKEIFENCALCERRCGVDRNIEAGHCGVREPRVVSEFLHFGEEPELVPSHTIFFAGCTLECVFCQNWDISTRPDSGRHYSPVEMAKLIDGQSGKAKNINWVGGDPTPNLPFVLEVIGHLEEDIAQVWNSNMYLSEEAMGLLDGVVDVYLTDLKFGNNECGERLAGVKGYWDIVRRDHILAKGQAEVIVRHLVMPGHVECCSEPILDWLAEEFGDTIRVNVMAQYRPEHHAFRYPEINKNLSIDEFRKAYKQAFELGLNLVD